MTDEEMIKKLTEIDQRGKSNTHRLDAIEEDQKALNKLAASVEVLATGHEHLKTDLTEIKTDVKALMDKPGKRWDGLVDKAIWAVAGAVVMWLLAGAPGI